MLEGGGVDNSDVGSNESNVLSLTVLFDFRYVIIFGDPHLRSRSFELFEVGDVV